jgi:hypothetical protein
VIELLDNFLIWCKENRARLTASRYKVPTSRITEHQ